MNKLEETIAMLESKDNRNELEDMMLHLLYEKAGELGVNPSEEEVEDAMISASDDFRAYLVDSRSGAEEADDDWDPEFRENMERVRNVFEEIKLHYREYIPQSGVYAFEVEFATDTWKLTAIVYLEAGPGFCRLDVIYPFSADPEFVYPLCEKLAAESYPRRYGALHYDASDHELSYRYGFSVKHGLYEDDFRDAFLAVTACAEESYDVVKRHAVGPFRRADREEIICKAQKLIIELGS